MRLPRLLDDKPQLLVQIARDEPRLFRHADVEGLEGIACLEGRVGCLKSEQDGRAVAATGCIGHRLYTLK